MCKKCLTKKKKVPCAHQQIADATSSLYKSKEFNVFYFSLEFFGRHFQGNHIDQVFVLFVFNILKRASEEGQCMIE